MVAGSSIILEEGITKAYERLGMVAQNETEKCYPFSEAARGYIRAEGVCVLIVGLSKKSNTMNQNFATPMAEIRGWGVNCNGGNIGYHWFYEFSKETALSYSARSIYIFLITYVKPYTSEN